LGIPLQTAGKAGPVKGKNEYVEMGYHREAECGMNLYLNV